MTRPPLVDASCVILLAGHDPPGGPSANALPGIARTLVPQRRPLRSHDARGRLRRSCCSR
jgi:hypothetical protein